MWDNFPKPQLRGSLIVWPLHQQQHHLTPSERRSPGFKPTHWAEDAQEGESCGLCFTSDSYTLWLRIHRLLHSKMKAYAPQMCVLESKPLEACVFSNIHFSSFVMLIEGSDLRLDISSPLFPEWCCSAQMEVLGIAYPVTHGMISWLLPVFSNHERTKPL